MTWNAPCSGSAVFVCRMGFQARSCVLYGEVHRDLSLSPVLQQPRINLERICVVPFLICNSSHQDGRAGKPILQERQDLAIADWKRPAQQIPDLGPRRDPQRLKYRGMDIRRTARLSLGKGAAVVAAAVDLTAANAATGH